MPERKRTWDQESPQWSWGGGLHLDQKCPRSCFAPCAKFTGEAQASLVPESWAFAGKAEPEQKLRLAASRMGCGWAVPFGEPGASILSPQSLSPAVATAIGHAETRAWQLSFPVPAQRSGSPPGPGHQVRAGSTEQHG